MVWLEVCSETMKRDLAPFGDSLYETIIENKGFTVWYGLRLGWGMENKRHNPMREGMMRLGIVRPTVKQQSGPGRKIRNIRAYLNRFIRTRYPFLMIAHKEEIAQEIEIVVLLADRAPVKDTSKLQSLANKHFRQFAKDNGWYRDQSNGGDRWVNAEQEWVNAAIEKYKQMARNERKGD